MHVKGFFLPVFFILVSIFVYSAELPVVTVMDFSVNEISKADGNAFTDLFIYNIHETGKYLVIERNERNKLIKGLGVSLENDYSENEIREIASLLNADIAVTGEISVDEGLLVLKIRKIHVDSGLENTDFTGKYHTVNEMTEDFRRISGELFPAGSAETANLFSPGKIAASLTPLPITERMLFVVPSGKMTPELAYFKQLLIRLSELLLKNGNVSIYFRNYNAEQAMPDLQELQTEADKNNYHSIILIKEAEEKSEPAVLTVYERDLKIRTEIRINKEDEMETVFSDIKSAFCENAYFVPQEILLKEIKRNIKISEKLENLIFAEEVLSSAFSIGLRTKLFTSVLAPEYHPNLNIASAVAGFSWYYDRLFGIGLEYEYSLGYPGTIDSKLADHPLISQHQIRLIPFRFRTAGKLSILLNIFSSIHFHNAYEIVFAPGDVHYYNNETIIWFLTAGLNLGLVLNLTKEWAVFTEIAEINYIIFRGPQPMDISRKRNFSGDFGGLGFIYRL